MSTIVQRLKTNLSKRRQKKVSGEKKKCISCDKIYSRRKGLHVHLNSDHQPTFCERIFSCLKYDWNPQLCLTNLFVNDIVVNKAKSEAIFINFVGVTFAHEDDQLTKTITVAISTKFKKKCFKNHKTRPTQNAEHFHKGFDAWLGVFRMQIRPYMLKWVQI